MRFPCGKGCGPVGKPAPSLHVIVSGCSGGGKSTLLDELRRRGWQTVPEPGRRIVQSELTGPGTALPWIDLAAFGRRAFDLAKADRKQVQAGQGWVFFDRGLVDAAAALQHATGQPVAETLAGSDRYHARVFLTPPWPEIYSADAERRHGFEDAVAEYQRLMQAFDDLDYHITVLPKVDVAARAEFLLGCLLDEAPIEHPHGCP